MKMHVTGGDGPLRRLLPTAQANTVQTVVIAMGYDPKDAVMELVRKTTRNIDNPGVMIESHSDTALNLALQDPNGEHGVAVHLKIEDVSGEKLRKQFSKRLEIIQGKLDDELAGGSVDESEGSVHDDEPPPDEAAEAATDDDGGADEPENDEVGGGSDGDEPIDPPRNDAVEEKFSSKGFTKNPEQVAVFLTKLREEIGASAAKRPTIIKVIRSMVDTEYPHRAFHLLVEKGYVIQVGDMFRALSETETPVATSGSWAQADVDTPTPDPNDPVQQRLLRITNVLAAQTERRSNLEKKKARLVAFAAQQKALAEQIKVLESEIEADEGALLSEAELAPLDAALAKLENKLPELRVVGDTQHLAA